MALHFDLSLEPHYGIAERLTSRIERLLAPNPGPFTFRGTGVYIVGAGERSVGESRSDQNEVAVIDPGPDLPEHNAALQAALAGRKVSHILITHNHNDHSPAARPLQEWSGAKIYGYGPLADKSDEGSSGEESYDHQFRPDILVSDGTVIAGEDFTIECVFTPGHTSNHMCYALAEEKALFTGDHVMGWSTSVIAPPDGNMGDYMRSLQKLMARGDAVLYPTHGSPVAEPGRLLRAYLTHRRMRETQIANCLARGDGMISAIVARLYADLKPALLPAAALTVRAHLEHMIEEDRVARQGEIYRIAKAP
ncbi:MAG TPA: MBL fold metallo-hydrolase [Rhizomicrobium sp.]|nr:MBL fold metallo-hydrolase [Rhizomicrobium sp.]